MSKNRQVSPHQVPLQFGDAFFQDYAGKLVADTNVALVELVANCWDAGAKRVDITWPENNGGYFEITDDGHGMTKNEFEKIWGKFNYNRRDNQGVTVDIPGISNQKRKVYGRNGKGRYSLFCFSDTYNVETWKNGTKVQYKVNKTFNAPIPYEINYVNESTCSGNGTKISCNINRNFVQRDNIEKLIGSKFVVNPLFEVYLNQNRVNLLDIIKNAQRFECAVVGEEGSIWINIIESTKGRLSTLHGVAWWVNDRPVGDHSWKDFDDTYLEYLDGRQNTAKRYSIIVQADLLENEVLEDWTWFKETPRSKNIRRFIRDVILDQIQNLLADVRTDRKIQTLSKCKKELNEMSSLSRVTVGKFVNEVQRKCPSIRQAHLDHTVEIFTKMEQSRTGYDLLQQLVQFDVDDIDKLTDFLKKWSVNQALTILSELEWRLELIRDIEKLVNNPKTDELHDLHPLFERGLWIFGTEFESKEFFSNQPLKTIIKEKHKKHLKTKENKRPDLVVFDDDSSLNIFANEKFDDKAEMICGYDKILILELKNSRSKIDAEDAHQVEAYATTLKNSGTVGDSAKIICYALGKTVGTEDRSIGNNVQIFPRSYDIVLRQAHARTFNLINKIKQIKGIEISDSEVNMVLAQKEISKA